MRADALWRREIEFYRRKKELAECELELARREIAMLCDQKRNFERATVPDAGGAIIPPEQPQMSLVTTGALLSDFDGISSDLETLGEAAKICKGDLPVERRLRQDSDRHETKEESISNGFAQGRIM